MNERPWSERVSPEELASALAKRDLAPRSARNEDIALVLALSQGQSWALAVLENTLLPNIRPALHRFKRDADFEEEVMQRLRVKLLASEANEAPPILEYQGRGPLAAWLQIIALREALMMMRATKRELSDDEQIMRLAFTEPVLARSKQIYKSEFAAAFKVAMEELDQQERTLLRLCFVEGAQAPQIAKLYAVHRVTAFRWLKDARESLLNRTRAAFLKSTKIPKHEIDSVMRSLAESLSMIW